MDWEVRMKREVKPLQAHIEVNDRMKEINSLQLEVENALKDLDEKISYSKSNNQRIKVAAFNNERKKLISLSSELYNKQLKELLRAVKNDKGYGGEYTLAEVGEALGITRERVRQLESMALKKMRSPRAARNFSRYVDLRLNPTL